MPDAIRNHTSLSYCCLRQQNAELLTTIPRRHVYRAQRTLQTVRSDLQREIARLMAVLIVVGFEIVDVDHQETHRIVVTLRTIELLRESLFQVATVRQRGERIRDRHELKLSRAFLPLRAFEGQRNLW